MTETQTQSPESPDLSETRQEITPERLALAVQRVSTDLMRHLNEMAEATFTPNLFRQDVEDLGIVLSALTAARADSERLDAVEREEIELTVREYDLNGETSQARWIATDGSRTHIRRALRDAIDAVRSRPLEGQRDA
jgi:hypothetical protein